MLRPEGGHTVMHRSIQLCWPRTCQCRHKSEKRAETTERRCSSAKQITYCARIRLSAANCRLYIYYCAQRSTFDVMFEVRRGTSRHIFICPKRRDSRSIGVPSPRVASRLRTSPINAALIALVHRRAVRLSVNMQV